MFVPKSRYLAAFASLLMGLASLSDSARAQSVRDAMNQRNARQRVGANAVPLRSFPGVGDTRFLPSDVTRRSLSGVPGFSDTKGSGKTRLQIGGPNGANVQEQVVNITNSALTDQLTPFWTNDEQFLYYASRPSGTGYQLRRVATGAVNNPLLPGNAVDNTGLERARCRPSVSGNRWLGEPNSLRQVL